MRTINLVIIADILFSLSSAGHLPWVWQNPWPQGNEYYGVCAINRDVVFLVDGEAGTISKTTDGGISWDITFTPYPGNQRSYIELHGITFSDSLTGYAVGLLYASIWNTQPYYAVILKTTDQGQSWSFKYCATFNSWLYDVYFLPGNNLVGYAVGWPGLILKTTDGGENWIQQTSGTSLELRAVHFPVDENIGYAVGGQDGGIFLKTTDGGTTWTASGLSGKGWDVYFINNQVGYIASCRNDYGGEILKTTDGGNSWQSVWLSENTFVYSSLFIDSLIGFAGGRTYLPNGWRSFILKTTDGGITWSPTLLPKHLFWVLPIDFADYQVGYAAGFIYDQNGGHGQILKTTDGGITWNFLNRGFEGIFWAVDFPEDEFTGFAAGDSGKIFKTTDGGLHWTELLTYTGLSFYDIDFLNNQLGLAVGRNGMVFKTTNGGNNWLPLNSNTPAHLLAVEFINPQVGYVGGFDPTNNNLGVILKTTDGGINWTMQTIPNNTAYRCITDLYFFNEDTGYATAGDVVLGAVATGLIYKTTDGGMTWVVNYTPGQIAMFYAIDFPENSQIGYVSGLMGGGGNYQVLKTTNGGISWTPLSTGTVGIVPASGVSFADNLTGYIVFHSGGSDMMMKTTNGGTSWFPINSLTNHSYEDIQAINANVVYAVGRGGMIRKTTNGGQVWIAEDEGDEDIKVDDHHQSLWVYPNPFRNNVHIRCRIHDTGYMIKIYDVSGRVVKSFNLESCILNHESSITWFGDDDMGNNLPAGVYFIVPENKSFSPVRVVKIR
ncbi:MAG: YCF48-related protein [candidate division WOR-3 bacterium]